LTLNHEHLVEEAFNILDFCKTALSNFIPSNPIVDETLKCLLAFGKGAYNSLSKTGEIITQPIPGR
jgi:hypothetical protein